MTVLDMDQGLVGVKGSRSSLEVIWKRYAMIVEAVSKVNDVDWASGKKPADSEIISVYFGKSSFYDQSKVLQHVKRFPDMIEWLERTDSDSDATLKLWGFLKPVYILKDLEIWLAGKSEEQKEEQKDKKDRKGKKKMTQTNSHKKSSGRK
jgi:hypothetical protein